MAIVYRYDKWDSNWNIINTWVGGLMLFYYPSECVMFVPGTYAEMMKEYE